MDQNSPFSFLERFLAFPLELLPFVVITLIVAFTVHEFAHAYVAYLFGDSTAKKQGRLTLNPIQHLDPFGTILLLIAGFGWARPVPVNRFYFKNPRIAGILVSVAGPVSNLLLAIIGFFILYLLASLNIGLNMPFVQTFLNIFIQLNLVLFVFNLLPLPPLDGYRIVEDLAPERIRPKLTQYETYGVVIFLILVITPLDQYTIQPIFQTVIPFIADGLSQFFSQLLL
ncbi:site-2 protease family protein [Bacillus sp. 03113]|uniref:site-2 protease family protein n=1 Tax=Bacillus sp. 03113 TaxID=2578211 RepID=UPI0011444AA5|nr:site-2 protease family protein [Bacillus sp. 03113]